MIVTACRLWLWVGAVCVATEKDGAYRTAAQGFDADLVYLTEVRYRERTCPQQCRQQQAA